MYIEVTQAIVLNNGAIAIINKEDLAKVSGFNWVWNYKTGVVTFHNKKTLYLHRVIMDCPKELVVDHIDHNKLNNTRANLRVCSQSQNSKNRKKSKNNTSGYKGVYYDNRPGGLIKRWVAQIKVSRKVKKLGRFLTAVEAAKKYDEFAKVYFGNFVDLNFKD